MTLLDRNFLLISYFSTWKLEKYESWREGGRERNLSVKNNCVKHVLRMNKHVSQTLQLTLWPCSVVLSYARDQDFGVFLFPLLKSRADIFFFLRCYSCLVLDS